MADGGMIGADGAHPYLGERARWAAIYIAEIWSEQPAERHADGWHVRRSRNKWDLVMTLPSHLVWSDETMIRMGEYDAASCGETLDAFIEKARAMALEQLHG